MSTDDENKRTERERRLKEDRKAEAAQRARKERDRASERAKKAQERGRHFHEGMAQLRGETRAAGWEHEKTIDTRLGERRHDTARYDEKGRLREFTEYKDRKRLDARALEQLSREREVLDRERQAHGTWVIREDTRVDSRVARQLEKMQRQYGDRFRVVYVSRERAHQAQLIGRNFEKGRSTDDQLELEGVKAEELRRQQQRKERDERIREQARLRELAAEALERDRAAERERAGHLRDRELLARARDLKARLPGVPDDVIAAIAAQSMTLSEAAAQRAREEREGHQRDAAERTRQHTREQESRGREEHGRPPRGR
ncbi:hypothetical protein [Nocardia tengchongensis]|uniref:hypothetical protein n=1 Tax=Nocardia tengchongensis TaxID=2055889 RepID=UPI00369B1B72